MPWGCHRSPVLQGGGTPTATVNITVQPLHHVTLFAASLNASGSVVVCGVPFTCYLSASQDSKSLQLVMWPVLFPYRLQDLEWYPDCWECPVGWRPVRLFDGFVPRRIKGGHLGASAQQQLQVHKLQKAQTHAMAADNHMHVCHAYGSFSLWAGLTAVASLAL